MSKNVTAVAAALFEEHGQGPMEGRHKVEWAVQWGLVTPADADAWARERGEEPFDYQPDPAGFDPMSLEEWSLAMATAWIIWRTPADVCRAWEPYATECRTWHRIDYVEPKAVAGGALTRRSGFEARPGKAPSPHDVIGDARAWMGMTAHMGEGFSRSSPVVHPNKVEDQVIAALRKRDGLGAFHSVMPDELIDRYEWANLSPFTSGSGPHDAVFYSSGKKVRFSQVRVKRDAVLALWPALDAATPIAVEAAAAEAPTIVATPEVDAGASPENVQAVEPMDAAGDERPEVRTPQVAPPIKTKRSTVEARAANGRKRDARKAQRLADIEQLVIEDPEITVDECVRRLKEKRGERFSASNATVQPELKAAKARSAEKNDVLGGFF